MPKRPALADYRRKRRFSRTPEPAGKAKPRTAQRLSFVIQKHAARRLHFDFRLELGGVLKSWAVPKGPSLDPREKRLAVQVEDHPLEYADFEGVIPEGEYGGGTVIVWDRGTWTPDGDAAAGLRAGKLKFRLDGERLHGGWTLVRIRSRQGGETNWLLIKERDDEARPTDEYDVVAAETTSVASGRFLERVAGDRDRKWKSSRSSKSSGKGQRAATTARERIAQAAARRATRGKTAARPSSNGKSAAVSPAKLVGAKRAALPGSIDAQLATLASKAPAGSQWLHEIKFDGYRLLCSIDKGRATLRTRNDLDWTERFPALADAARKLPVRSAVLDGEVVALLTSGASSFQELQNAFRERRADALVYYVFDLLYLDGYDLRGAALEERKALLAKLIGRGDAPARMQYTDHLAGNGDEFLTQCCRMGLEGIISKRRDRPYRGGRSHEWLKIKCVQREEFVIGGYTAPTASRKGLGALLVGYYDDEGRLVYAGRVGTGFSDQVLLDLRARLQRRERKQSPFAGMPAGSSTRGVHWVEPELVAQVEYGSWTRDGVLRHPSFQGLREDKEANAVVRETPADQPETPTETKQRPKRGGAKRKSKISKIAAAAEPAVAASGKATEGRDELAGVRLTHPDRVLYAEQGITKLGLAEYYAAVAEWILPHVTNRPLSLVRCPRGRGGHCFYQKHAAAGTPDTLERVPIVEKSKRAEYLAVRDLAGLISLVQMGVLEIHPWGSRTDDLERPDRMIFDLDPHEAVPWARVVESAKGMRDFLKELGLASFVKTTGGKGLHVVVPLQRRSGWDDVKQFAKAVVERFERESPQHYTTNMSKAARPGRIFLDYLRNDRGATAVAAYSTRAKLGATVSVPLSWDELSTAIQSDHFHVGNVPGRLTALKRDPWHEFFRVRQSLTARTRKRLGG